MENTLLRLLLLTSVCSCLVLAAMDSCYDEQGSLSRCLPKFENAAFNKTVTASNVCGLPPEDYCMQAGPMHSCHHCDASDPQQHHNVTYLTDFHSHEESTWWQSQSMFYGIQHPTSVNLTLHLGKAFMITYIRLKFHTSRPESFAIYKRLEEGGPWIPYQYYSASCKKTYGKDAKEYIRPGDDERTALCTDEFSDISPLTGGNVAFSTLEGRPSAYNFDRSPVLQEWVTATDLLISLDRLNTFGDEFFKDAKVLRSYYYAISDFSVGGRCKCNGHASECLTGDDGQLVCACQHHTDGADCQKCQPFYQDRPWARATADSANECRSCNCSGRTDECVFDAELFRSTGSGGRCVNCGDNTDGPHCERCRDNFYRAYQGDVCLPCNCSVLGSSSLQCGNDGLCHCRQSVTGEKCDNCQPGFHSLGPAGCRPCECHPSGSVSSCSPLDGQCPCKENVEGHTCDRCKPGSFNLASDSPAGCESCFCFGHSVACASSSRYSAISLTSDFVEDPDGWIGEFSGGLESHLIWKEGEVYLLPYSEDDIGFYKAPETFLGNQLLSYGQLLAITFVAESPELLPRQLTLVLQGSDVTVSIDFSPEPSLHSVQAPQRTFSLRLNERGGGLSPPLTALEFRRLLFNLTALKISNAGGHNYTSQLSGVTLSSAAPSRSPNAPAPWVEECTCPPGHAGQFCEHCAPGHKREVPNGGSFVRCVPCACNQHGDCHSETGVEGLSCDSCRKGFFGFSSRGCRACNCDPMGSITMQCHSNGTCSCREGFVGNKCDKCELNYFHNRATHQCEECPVCYSLVREQADNLQLRLQSLEKLLGHYSCRGRQGPQQHPLQGEDTLPNALEDFLAIQEAREAFVSQFTQLEASARTLAVRLRSVIKAMNCSSEGNEEEGRRRVCGALTRPAASVSAAQVELRKAIHTLGSMVIPFEVPKGPNQWNVLVNESQVLGKSHKEAASHIESIAKKALMASNQTYSLLMALLEDNSTEVHIRSLTDQLLEMHQAKQNLTAQANETLSEAKEAYRSIQRDSAQIASALVNFTASLQHRTNDSQLSLVQEQTEDLINRTGELKLQVQSNEELVLKIEEGLAPHIESAQKHAETIQKFDQLSAGILATKAAALSSVVKGKEVESESSALMKGLEDMRKEWPRMHAQTKAAVKKERMVEERILGDARKKAKQAERIVKPALDNSTLSNSTASQAKSLSDTVSKEAKETCSQAKSTKRASVQLSSSVDAVLQELEYQEHRAAQMQMDGTNETEDTVVGMSENIEAAKLKLETYSMTLTELLSKIEREVANEKFHRILRETETWLGFLRHSVESPALSGKIQALHDAAQDQEAQILQVDRDIEEIKEERRSLQDIVLHLPQGCAEVSKVGKL
ncbi:hypothetical protein SKAU_G00359670 [Synaphobranchus kaupii]|uniref:Laminin subunit gamma-3 n=1 Tax=Synaphobranchus kaupii TaxID=118154 RepID=A0A9Q1IGZ7_SYNKA|nr:hypothetical protein SKAU_G00359670 [Synaphobranchus kaupii]